MPRVRIFVRIMSVIQENIRTIRERIERARAKSRYGQDVTLVAVTKTHPPESIRDAYDAGLRHFGENRVQEWEGKRDELADVQATWHLIGHLQSNKASRASKLFHAIDSMDDFALAQRLDHAFSEAPTAEKLRILIEVRIADETTKSGAEIPDLPQLVKSIRSLPNLQIAGLMCIPPFLEPQAVRPYFSRLRNLRDELVQESALALPVLSMGMSHDFEVAIEEGATEVRIGSAIFGPRPVK